MVVEVEARRRRRKKVEIRFRTNEKREHEEEALRTPRWHDYGAQDGYLSMAFQRRIMGDTGMSYDALSRAGKHKDSLCCE